MIGLVLVCHSAKLAEGVAELAAAVGGEGLRIAVAGGLDEPGDLLGTDAVRVARAIADAWSGDGVLVLMDLGSAVLSAEMAVELLPEGRRDGVLLAEAPLLKACRGRCRRRRAGRLAARGGRARRAGAMAGKAAH